MAIAMKLIQAFRRGIGIEAIFRYSSSDLVGAILRKEFVFQIEFTEMAFLNAQLLIVVL